MRLAGLAACSRPRRAGEGFAGAVHQAVPGVASVALVFIRARRLQATGLASRAHTFLAAKGFAVQISGETISWIALVALSISSPCFLTCADAAFLFFALVALVGFALGVLVQLEAPIAGEALLLRRALLQELAFQTFTAQPRTAGVWLTSAIQQLETRIAL